jgi:CBS domain-containing protein
MTSMSDGPRRITRVKHPILHLEVLGPGGERSSEHRVFCRYQQRSVPVGTCCACVHCDTIEAFPNPTVNCSITVEEATPDPLGVRTAVGSVLEQGVVTLDPRAPLAEVLAALRAQNRRSIAVVDESHAVVGIVHETTFLRLGTTTRPSAVPAEAVDVMSGFLAIHEKTPVRRALELLAGAHLREATVVNDAGVPIGVFRDVDGLRWIALSRAKSIPPAAR